VILATIGSKIHNIIECMNYFHRNNEKTESGANIVLSVKKKFSGKTIFCGPPHSGKSVFIANLIRYLPYDSYVRINANGDGEGTWSNNSDQDEVMRTRHKTGNTPADFARWTKRIRQVRSDIVLIDVGGRILEDKVPMFEAADCFVIISSDVSMVEAWRDFGESHGCRCLAIIESCLEGEEEICLDDGIIRARMSGLERGVCINDSKVLRAVAERLIEISGYRHEEVLDFYSIGKFLGCSTSWTTTKGETVECIHFPLEKAGQIQEYLSTLWHNSYSYKIMNLKVNWVGVIAAQCLCRGSLSNISFYDEWTDRYLRPCKLRVSNECTQGLDFSIEETDRSVFLKVGNPIDEINTDNFHQYILPEINEEKPLFLSGRFPVWFTVSILGSYSSSEQYFHQPGNHYICVKASDSTQLGKVVNEPF